MQLLSLFNDSTILIAWSKEILGSKTTVVVIQNFFAFFCFKAMYTFEGSLSENSKKDTYFPL